MAAFNLALEGVAVWWLPLALPIAAGLLGRKADAYMLWAGPAMVWVLSYLGPLALAALLWLWECEAGVHLVAGGFQLLGLLITFWSLRGDAQSFEKSLTQPLSTDRRSRPRCKSKRRSPRRRSDSAEEVTRQPRPPGGGRLRAPLPPGTDFRGANSRAPAPAARGTLSMDFRSAGTHPSVSDVSGGGIDPPYI